MKKTTIILAASLGAAIAGAFLFPLFIGVKERDHAAVIEFSHIGTTDTIKFERNINSIHIEYPEANCSASTFSIVIEESPTATMPYLIADKSWAENIKVVYDDSVATLTYPMEAAQRRQPDYSYINIPNDNLSLGHLIVPAGTLSVINSPSATVTLSGFKNADITLRQVAKLTCEDCSFRSLKNLY